MSTYKQRLFGIGEGNEQRIVDVYSQGTPTYMVAYQWILRRGGRYVGMGTAETAKNWLEHGQTATEQPANRFNPHDYPPEQCL